MGIHEDKQQNKLQELTRVFAQINYFGKKDSVFECFLNAVKFSEMQIKIEKLIKPEEDSLRVYVLDGSAVKRTMTYGLEKSRQEQAIII